MLFEIAILQGKGPDERLVYGPKAVAAASPQEAAQAVLAEAGEIDATAELLVRPFAPVFQSEPSQIESPVYHDSRIAYTRPQAGYSSPVWSHTWSFSGEALAALRARETQP